MKLFYYYIIILLLMGCGHNNTVKKLESNKTITDVFDKSEIKDLAVIVDFFNKQICSVQNSEKKTITQCYQRYFEWIKECEKTGNFDTYHITYQEQQKMYSQISENTFHQLWRIDQRWYRAYKDETDTLEVIDITYDGKYLKFLKEFGKENNFIELYVDRFEQVGDIGPTCYAMVTEEYKKFDISDIRIQFFIAMHYLTLNDTLEVRKKFKPHTSYENYRIGTLPKSSKELKKRNII